MGYVDVITGERIEVFAETPQAYFIIKKDFNIPQWVPKTVFYGFYKEEENEMPSLPNSHDITRG